MERIGNESLRRTDLARELDDGSGGSAITRNKEYFGRNESVFTVEETEIVSETLSKPRGKYITISCPELISALSVAESLDLSDLVANELRCLSRERHGGVTVIGMGNREMTVDSLGVRCAEMIMPTRKAESGGREGLSVIIPGVEASTGITTFETVSSVVSNIKPSLAVAVDSLAARSVSRLGKTIQLSDTGISPGSGIGKRALSLNREALGIPVLSVGVPTVIAAETMLSELCECRGKSSGGGFYVGLIESDAVIEASARILAVAIEKAFS